jgi:hypothetical protein
MIRAGRERKMPESQDTNAAGVHNTITDRVRGASRAGRLLPLEIVWQGTAEDFVTWRQSPAKTVTDDVVLIRERGDAFLYSELFMTRSFAETAARAACKDICWAIAQTVRSDSQTYPRPTPLSAFREPPFIFPKETLDRALQDIPGNPEYADIRSVRSSDGAIFLFSSIHLNSVQAESLAEWLAVGHLRNP